MTMDSPVARALARQMSLVTSVVRRLTGASGDILEPLEHPVDPTNCQSDPELVQETRLLSVIGEEQKASKLKFGKILII